MASYAHARKGVVSHGEPGAFHQLPGTVPRAGDDGGLKLLFSELKETMR